MLKAVRSSDFNLLSIFLCFSNLAGCFPTKNPFGNPVDFGFKLQNIPTLYAVVILVFSIASSLNYFIWGLPTYVGEAFGSYLASVICGYMDGINFLTNAMVVRIFAIIYCAKTVELIKIIHSLKEEIESKFLVDEKSMQRDDEAPNPPKNYALRKLNLNQKPFSSRKVYLILWVTILLHCINHMVRITDFVASHQSSGSPSPLLLLPEGFEWASPVLWWLNHTSATIAYCFSLPVGVILGVELISIYHKFKSILLNTLLGDDPALKNQEDREHFMTSFKTLMDGFGLFSEVAGTFALINIVCATVAQGQSIYQLVDSSGSTSIQIQMISMAIVRFFWLYNQVSIGELIQYHIKEGREEVRNALAFGRNLPRTENVRELAEWMAGWTWNLTARNLFNVDRSLMLGVFQTVMTYVIFLFQLKLSDPPN